jgi:two-component system sensor histidine kinase DctS
VNPTEAPLARRVALWGALVALLLVAQSLLVVLTLSFEKNRSQEQIESAAAGAAAELRQGLARHEQSLQALDWTEPTPDAWRVDAAQLLRAHREIVRIERRDAGFGIGIAADSPYQAPLFERIPREEIDVDAEVACSAARRLGEAQYSRSYFVPQGGGHGMEVIDLCVLRQRTGRPVGYTVATVALVRLLEAQAGTAALHGHELSFVEADGTRLARSGLHRGTGVFVAERIVDLPGAPLQLRVDSGQHAPGLIPNLAVALVLGLSLALFVVVALLVRDGRRRAAAEELLAEALAFRKAMEDSLVTGLRARDRRGRITYVNPAFCEMVGYSAAELMAKAPPEVPPYWPPESVAEYQARQAERQSAALSRADSRTGFETQFMRKNGERFPVLIFEAPLVDGLGKHAGWMSAVLDMSTQRRIEEVSRQQQERLAATARLATVGEMASLLSHELNQPLAAIASFATGSLNLIDAEGEDPATLPMVRQATQRIAEQAERAGRVIKSVHDFVRRREQAREALRADHLLDAVLPLVRLQARKSGTRIEVDIAEPPPRVSCDRTMVEQVLLNLTRNAIQSMDSVPDPAGRVLTLRVRQTHARWVGFSVIDRGPGIPADVAARLFTPFFTTRIEGMGLGLSLCRTVIEQHGGALDFTNLDPGCEFRFTLPAAGLAGAREAVEDAEASETAPR